MSLQEYISEWNVTLLTEDDIESLYSLCKSNPIYYKYMNEKLSKQKLSLNLIDTPPNADRKNKYYYGIWKKGQLNSCS